MTLDEYLKKQDIKASQFAAMIGVAVSTVSRLLKGQRRPSWELAAKIEATTAGNVTLADFQASVKAAA